MLLYEQKHCTKQSLAEPVARSLSIKPFDSTLSSNRRLHSLTKAPRPSTRTVNSPSGQQRHQSVDLLLHRMSCGWQRERRSRESHDRCIAYRLRQIIWGCPTTPWNKKDGAFLNPLHTDKPVQRSRLMSIYLITVDRALNASIWI